MTIDVETQKFIDDVKDRLRACLKARGIPFAEASVNANKKEHFVSKMLGRDNPTLESVASVCLANGIDPSEVFVDEDTFRKLSSIRALQGTVGGTRPDLAARLAESFKKRQS